MQSAMYWTIVDDVMVCVASSGVPDKETLARFLHDLRTKPIRRFLTTPLSLSDAVCAERTECGAICTEKRIHVAVVVDPEASPEFASIARFADVESFPWSQVDAALHHLDVSGPAFAQARQALMKLRAECSVVAV